MIVSQLAWFFVLVLVLAVALIQLLGVGAWLAPDHVPVPLGGSPRDVATAANQFAAVLLQLVLEVSFIGIGCGLTAFISATNQQATQKTVRMRDYASAALQSLTGRWFLFGASTAALLSVELRRPVDVPRTVVMLVLLGLLIVAWVMVFRGIRRITATNRKNPYFFGLTENQKLLAENPWPTRNKPTFPVPEQVDSEEDALRYARRARSIARLHEWIGGGIIAVATAVLGSSVAQFFLPSVGVSPWIIGIVALGTLALGYAIHRRGSQYSRLREQFERAAVDLKHASIRATLREPRGLRAWILKLLDLRQ